MAKLQRVGLFGTFNRSRTLLIVQMLSETHSAEVARILGVSLSVAQKTVDSLERAGILVGAEEGNTRRIRLNPRYPYLEELTALLTKMGVEDLELQSKLADTRRRPRRSGKKI